MKMKTVHARILFALLPSVAAVAALFACSTGTRATAEGPAAQEQRKPAAMSLTRESKSGNQLWEESCGKCHNFRSPASYNADGWEVVMQHMRLRANLTADEKKAIAEFLKSSTDAGTGDQPHSRQK